MMDSAAIYSSSAMVRMGRRWFKLRSLSPLPLFFFLSCFLPIFIPSRLVVSLVLLGIIVAESIRVWAVGYAGSATRTRGETVSDFVHAGPYRFVRNPLYVANILLYTLCGLLFGSLVVTGDYFRLFVHPVCFHRGFRRRCSGPDSSAMSTPIIWLVFPVG